MHATPDALRHHLQQAAARQLLTDAQVTPLADYLIAAMADAQRDTPSFKMTHILYYLGGMLAIGAMTLFMTLGWEQFGGVGLLVIASVYATVGLLLAEHFLRKLRLAIPAGILIALVVALVPMAVYGLQQVLGLWPEGMHYRDYHVLIDWRWFVMEIATLIAGAALLWRYRLPFAVMPVAVTLWYLSMDLTPLLYQMDDGLLPEFARQKVSMAVGAVMLLLAFKLDLHQVRNQQAHETPKDFAFWLYLFGVLAFWGGLSMMDSGSELGKLLYACINLLMIGVGAALVRRVFAVFGGLGLAFYLGHLAHQVFRDSLLFPIALTAIGLGVIWVGILWQKHEPRLGGALRQVLPATLRTLVERRTA